MVTENTLYREKKEKNKYVFLLLLAVFMSFVAGTAMIDRVSVLLILYICIRLGMKEESPVNPYYLFAITPISLLIYINIGDAYMANLTHNTWLLGIMNMAAFVIALVLTRPVKFKVSYDTKETVSSLTLHAIILFALSFMGNLIPELESVFWICAVPAIVCAIMSKRVGLFLLVGLYLVISFTIGSVSKSFMLMLAMTILVIYDKYYAVTKKSKRRVFLLMIAGIALMLAAFSFANKDRGSYDADDGVTRYSAQGITWTGATRFFMPYMYLTNAWTNLQFVTETQDSRTYGLWMAKPVLGYLQLDDSFGPIYNLESYSSFNTFGFITCGFKDFGYWLSVISALMLGFFVKKIYSRFLLSRSPFDVACYVLVGLATLEMFFSNHFFMQSYPFTVVIIMGLYKFVAARLFRNKRTSNQSIVSA